MAPGNLSRRQSEAPIKDVSPEPDFESSGDDDDLDDEQKEARVKRRLNREVKYLKNKLDRLKDKQHAAKRERQAIRESMKKNQVILKYVLNIVIWYPILDSKSQMVFETILKNTNIFKGMKRRSSRHCNVKLTKWLH